MPISSPQLTIGNHLTLDFILTIVGQVWVIFWPQFCYMFSINDSSSSHILLNVDHSNCLRLDISDSEDIQSQSQGHSQMSNFSEGSEASSLRLEQDNKKLQSKFQELEGLLGHSLGPVNFQVKN